MFQQRIPRYHRLVDESPSSNISSRVVVCGPSVATGADDIKLEILLDEQLERHATKEGRTKRGHIGN